MKGIKIEGVIENNKITYKLSLKDMTMIELIGFLEHVKHTEIHKQLKFSKDYKI